MIIMRAEEMINIRPSGFRFTLLISCPGQRLERAGS